MTCFRHGTRVSTKRGEVAVEDLAVGDLVVTSSGANRPIRRLGHRTIDCRQHPRPHEAYPVRIAALAFGANRPGRDLYVSPGLSICVDVLGEVLVTAGSLINGATVQQVEVDKVTYWRVELDGHDILLAENLACESYLETGDRRDLFAESEVVALDARPDTLVRTHADLCRPFHLDGPLIDVLRSQLRRRATLCGWTLTDALELHLEVDGRRIEPVVSGLTARFQVPAGAKDVWLVSPTARPCDTLGTSDFRELGVDVAALYIEDDPVPLTNPLLCEGFHEVEDGSRRWTAGRARLPAALWAGRKDEFCLRVEMTGRPVRRWVAPATRVLGIRIAYS